MPPSAPRDPRHVANLMLSLIPEDVRKQLGSTPAGVAELNDRLVESARLGAQARDLSLSPDLRKAARIRSQAILKAQPRETTERQHQELIAKAAAMPAGFKANMAREHAQQLLEDHPIAPRRGAAVRKAKAVPEDELPIVVFDGDGNCIGIVDPDDVQPVAGNRATPQAPAAMAGEPVTKGQRLSVWDQHGQRYVVTRAKIRKTAWPRPGVYDDGPLYPVLGGQDTGYGTGVASPEEQARNRGPVRAGGTTGLGMARRTGPPAASPADGPQQARPGDVPGRQVVKSSIGLPFRTLGEAAREKRLTRIEMAIDRNLRRPHVYMPNSYSPEGHCLCEAPAAHPAVHTNGTRVHIDYGRAAVAKASSWRPGLSNAATERWLAAQRRR